jgi:hypothetical protein
MGHSRGCGYSDDVGVAQVEEARLELSLSHLCAIPIQTSANLNSAREGCRSYHSHASRQQAAARRPVYDQ